MPLCYTSFKSFSNKISDIFIRATFICGLCLDCEVLVKIAVWILRWFLSHRTGFSDCTGSCLKETVPFQGSFTKNLIPSNCMYYHVSFCIPKSFERVAYDYLKFCCQEQILLWILQPQQLRRRHNVRIINYPVCRRQ